MVICNRSWFLSPHAGVRCGFALTLLCATYPNSSRAIDNSYPAVDECEWPASVQVWVWAADNHPVGWDTDKPGKCSGVYVGNHIVLTVGHCIAYMDTVEVRFGEHGDSPAYTDTNPDCREHPDADWEWVDGVLEDGWVYEGRDIAYCKLSAGHPEPPYVPVMVSNGCEVDYIRHRLFGPDSDPFGDDVSFVASGAETFGSDPPVGTKRIGPGTVLFERYDSIHHGQAVVLLEPNEGEDIVVHQGDSGGPIQYAMPNGTWRTIGVISYTTGLNLDLDGSGQEVRHHVVATSVPRRIPWIEESSKNDITPCHEWDGTQWNWEGGPSCGQEFDTSPNSSTSDWPGCSSSTLDTATVCAGWSPPPPDDIAILPGTGSDGEELVLHVAAARGAARPLGMLAPSKDTTESIGTTSHDLIVAEPLSPTELVGGRGHDLLVGSTEGDEIFGGAGCDLLVGGAGNDLIIPGRGINLVVGQQGDDTVVIRGTCELAAGTLLDGGLGHDVLYTPVDLATLQAFGVLAVGFEEVIVSHPDVETASCATLVDMGPYYAP